MLICSQVGITSNCGCAGLMTLASSFQIRQLKSHMSHNAIRGFGVVRSAPSIFFNGVRKINTNVFKLYAGPSTVCGLCRRVIGELRLVWYLRRYLYCMIFCALSALWSLILGCSLEILQRGISILWSELRGPRTHFYKALEPLDPVCASAHLWPKSSRSVRALERST